MSCCNTLYALDPVIGIRIARGEDIEILPEHLTEVQTAGEAGISAAATAVLRPGKIMNTARNAEGSLVYGKTTVRREFVSAMG